jgi:hypothetical protein
LRYHAINQRYKLRKDDTPIPLACGIARQ